MFKAMLIKEFILVLRDHHALAALFIMPAVFILIMSLALKDTFNSERALLTYAVIDEDNSDAAVRLSELLQENKGLVQQAISGSEWKHALNPDIHFVLTIPAGFSRNLEKNENGGGAAFCRLDVDAEVKENMLAIFKLELAMAITRLRIETIKDALADYLPDMAQEFSGIGFFPDNMVDVHFNAMTGDEKPTSTQQSVPSWIVFAMFFIVIPMSTIFINERKQNTLSRMNAMNISIPALFAGKIAPYMVINQIQVWIMIGVGMFIVPLFGAEPLTLGNSPGGLVLISLGLSLAAIGTSVLVAVTAATVEQATTIGGIINILLGALGGIMVPKFIMPPIMQKVAAVSPMSWGLDGFLDILLRGQGISAVIPESCALGGFGAGLLIMAAMRLKVSACLK